MEHKKWSCLIKSFASKNILMAETFFKWSQHQSWKKKMFPCKLGKFSFQPDKFPSSVGWFPLSIFKTFFFLKIIKFPCKELPIFQVIPAVVNTLSTIVDTFLSKSLKILCSLNHRSSYIQILLACDTITYWGIRNYNVRL